MKCLTSYVRGGSRYVGGQEYAIDEATAEAHEAYFGRKLWAHSKSEAKRIEVQTEEASEEVEEKPKKRKKSKK